MAVDIVAVQACQPHTAGLMTEQAVPQKLASHLPDLMSGAQAFIAMLVKIGEQATAAVRPASDATADIQTAYRAGYEAVDAAIASSLDKHSSSEGFRRALGHYLLNIAQGNVPDLGKMQAADLLADNGFRAMPAQDSQEGSSELYEGAGTHDERQEVAVEASYEVESIAIALQGLEDTTSDWILARGMFMRIEALNSVVMSVIGGDDSRQLVEMEAVVFGKRNAGQKARRHD